MANDLQVNIVSEKKSLISESQVILMPQWFMLNS